MKMLMAEKKDEPSRRTLKALLTESEYEAFRQAHAPMSQVDALALIIKWFTAQEDEIRKEILGMLPQRFRGDIARKMLEEMAEGDPRAPAKREGRGGSGRKSA